MERKHYHFTADDLDYEFSKGAVVALLIFLAGIFIAGIAVGFVICKWF